MAEDNIKVEYLRIALPIVELDGSQSGLGSEVGYGSSEPHDVLSTNEFLKQLLNRGWGRQLNENKVHGL